MNGSMNNQLVKTSIHSNCVLRITLNNPSQHNVLSEEMMSAIQSVLDKSVNDKSCLLYTSPSPRDRQKSRMPSSA